MFSRLKDVSVAVLLALVLSLAGGLLVIFTGADELGAVLLVWGLLAGVLSLREVE